MKNDKVSDDIDVYRFRAECVTEFWSHVAESGDAGQTTMEILDSIGLRVTACLERGVPGIELAEALTAKAMLLMTGQM